MLLLQNHQKLPPKIGGSCFQSSACTNSSKKWGLGLTATRQELRAHFHPTELFKGELGRVSWEAARDLVKPVYEAMSSGGPGFSLSLNKGYTLSIPSYQTVFDQKAYTVKQT